MWGCWQFFDSAREGNQAGTEHRPWMLLLGRHGIQHIACAHHTSSLFGFSNMYISLIGTRHTVVKLCNPGNSTNQTQMVECWYARYGRDGTVWTKYLSLTRILRSYVLHCSTVGILKYVSEHDSLYTYVDTCMGLWIGLSISCCSQYQRLCEWDIDLLEGGDHLKVTHTPAGAPVLETISRHISQLLFTIVALWPVATLVQKHRGWAGGVTVYVATDSAVKGILNCR